MPDDSTLHATRIGPDPSELREIHRVRQSKLPITERDGDPSAPHQVTARMRARDEMQRARHEYKMGQAND
jgi:hypothetical protein